MKEIAHEENLPMKWEIRHRLEFIETRLFWNGRINRGDLMRHFGISGVQATNDISRYDEIAPQNILYDRNEKAYVAGEDYQPVLIQPRSEDFLAQLAREKTEPLAEMPAVEVLPLPLRKVDIQVLRQVVKAIKSASILEIKYQSMSKPEPGWRMFAPHSFAHDGMRWHIRAFCFTDNRFKDFLLARILATGKMRPGVVFREDDKEWNLQVDVVLVPHPELSIGQKRVIEADFGMVNGSIKITVRQALLPYFLQRLSLIEKGNRPEEQQVIVLNKDEVLALNTI